MATRQAPAKLAGRQAPVPPNQTLYVTNLPSSKIQKADLKTAIYMLFSTYGPVLDVVCLRTTKMRGQAHVVFRDLQAATQAMRSLEGFTFLGKSLRIQYAKSKSDIISKLDGSYKMPGTAGADAKVEMTETQQNIFNAPAPGAAATAAPAATRGLPAKPPTTEPPTSAPGTGARGHKRTRDEEDEEEEEEEEEDKQHEKEAEEESDEDVAMEEDSDDD